VNSPMIEMGGTSQYGTSFGMAHFECAAAGSGALAIKDGLDTAYVGWNPESDMGNIEIWEQNMPMLYLGRSILPNSGGAGKYRGGCSFISTWLINKTNHLRLVTSEHSSRVFDNAGMCGGYPAPTCQMHRTVRKTNINELIKKQKPLPHGIGIDPDHSDLEKLVKGVHETSEGPYITAPHKSGDIFTHAYNGGGGFGDVLERDPIKTASDVENGFLTAQVAHQVFGIVLVEDRGGTLQADLAATGKLRTSMRGKRLKKSIPVSQWMKDERKRVSAGRFVIEVTRMYASAMKLSKRFTRDFNSFWGLKPSFTYKVED
jgi:acetone carboxylase, alpha subunit